MDKDIQEKMLEKKSNKSQAENLCCKKFEKVIKNAQKEYDF